MALGSYLSTHAEVAYQEAQIHRERREIEEQPGEELNEMRQIYQGYGMDEDEIKIFLAHFQRDKKLWLKLMLRDELGIVPESFESPWKNAVQMAFAVAAGSLAPLLPIILGGTPKHMFSWVLWLSAMTAFGLGAVTARSTSNPWWRSGIEFLFVAAIAAGIGMGAGILIAPLFAA
jgi:VIT1/CCC1 family predicted Fe2+/Mn2+ transporter